MLPNLMPPAECHSPALDQPSPPDEAPAARARMEKVPDEGTARARILALDRDAEAPAPAGHRAVRAGRRERLDDRLDDFLRAVAGAERDRCALARPHDGAFLDDHLDRPQHAVVRGTSGSMR
jgi:hypothetical protein